MPAPPFWSPAVLQRDLCQLGHAAVPASVAPSGGERRAALFYLARLVDPDRAPDPSAAPDSLDRFWAALGLPALDPAAAAAHPARARRHAAAFMRAAIDLAFAARAAEYSSATEFVPEDAPADAVRAALVDNLYRLFPRAVPSYPEPKFKPKKRRQHAPPLNGTPAQPRGRPLSQSMQQSSTAHHSEASDATREPLAVLRSLSEANKAAGEALVTQSRVFPRAPVFDNNSPHVTVDEDTVHVEFLSLGRMERGEYEGNPDVDFATDAEIQALSDSCRSATEAGNAYRVMASEALALAVASTTFPVVRDVTAEAMLDEHLCPARNAQAAAEAIVSRVARIRTAYEVIAEAPHEDFSDSEVSIASCVELSKRADQYGVQLDRGMAASESTSTRTKTSRPRAPRLPSREY